MSRSVHPGTSPSDPPAKELTRKLYWAISSTIDLNRDQKKSTFNWCADLADKLLERAAVPPPPASRPGNQKGKEFAMEQKKRYASQAGGGAAGSSNGPSSKVPSKPPLHGASHHPAVPTVAAMAAFTAQQAAMRDKAVAYMRSENRRLGIVVER